VLKGFEQDFSRWVGGRFAGPIAKIIWHWPEFREMPNPKSKCKVKPKRSHSFPKLAAWIEKASLLEKVLGLRPKRIPVYKILFNKKSFAGKAIGKVPAIKRQVRDKLRLAYYCNSKDSLESRQPLDWWYHWQRPKSGNKEVIQYKGKDQFLWDKKRFAIHLGARSRWV